jgi:RNA polymerase sigma factor (sigma-70 family)
MAVKVRKTGMKVLTGTYVDDDNQARIGLKAQKLIIDAMKEGSSGEVRIKKLRKAVKSDPQVGELLEKKGITEETIFDDSSYQYARNVMSEFEPRLIWLAEFIRGDRPPLRHIDPVREHAQKDIDGKYGGVSYPRAYSAAQERQLIRLLKAGGMAEVVLDASNEKHDAYVNGLRFYGIDTGEERVISKIKAIQQQKSEVKALFIEHNGRFAQKEANKYVGTRGLGKDSPVEDLIAEGIHGIVMAVDRYDPLEGSPKFSTYAGWWIKQAIHKYVDDAGRSIKIPAEIGAIMRRYDYAKNKVIEMKNNEGPVDENGEIIVTEEEIIDYMNRNYARQKIAGDLKIRERQEAVPEEMIDRWLAEHGPQFDAEKIREANSRRISTISGDEPMPGNKSNPKSNKDGEDARSLLEMRGDDRVNVEGSVMIGMSMSREVSEELESIRNPIKRECVKYWFECMENGLSKQASKNLIARYLDIPKSEVEEYAETGINELRNSHGLPDIDWDIFNAVKK